MPNKITLNTLSVRQDVKMKIAEVCDEVKDLLIRKNDAYGNSFMFPINVFQKPQLKSKFLSE